MNKKLISFIIFFALVIGIFIFHKKIFIIKNIHVIGNNWIKPQVIKKLVNKKKSLLNLNKKKLSKKIRDLGYVDEVNISIKLLNDLVINIREKSIVGKIEYLKKNYYLTSKGEILSGKSYILNKKIPKILIKKKINNDKLISLSNNLDLIKFHDKNFFDKIDEISFDTEDKPNIFIVLNSNKYLLNFNFTLEDLLKIKFIESKKLKYSSFDLRGNPIVIKR